MNSKFCNECEVLQNHENCMALEETLRQEITRLKSQYKELVEAAEKLDTGHHALCNAPLNQWCSCGLTDLKTAMSKLKEDV